MPGRSSPLLRGAAAGILLLIAAACGPDRPVVSPAPPGLRDKVVTLVRHLAGLPYQYGGEDIDGFDCSGLVHYVFHCFGIDVPRTARAQARMSGRVSWRRARPGDLLAFRMKSGWHTAVLIRDSRFIHAPGRGRRLETVRMNAWWRRRLKAVIDVIGG